MLSLNFKTIYGALNHKGSYEGKDGVELRKGGVDHSVGLNVVTLADAHDTIGTYLTLTDGREKANQTHCEADAEKKRSLSSEVLASLHEEGYEAVETLGGRHSRENHIAGRLLRVLLKSTLCCITSDCGSDGGTDSGKAKHKAKSEIT